MTFVVTDACIRCKYMDCVEICPTDAFHEGETMLVISPDQCIDCNLCTPECPADAIRPDIDSGLERWIALNAEYSAVWPAVSVKRQPPADADAFRGVAGKYERYFTPEPGEGD